MNGDSLFVDTNILLYIINGDSIIKDQINNKSLYISFITEIELLCFQKISNDQDILIKSLLKDLIIIPYQEMFKEKIIDLRKNYKLKIPDAIIAASAFCYDLPIITADKSFSKINDLTVYLYKK